MKSRLAFVAAFAILCIAGAGTAACAQTVKTDAQSGERRISYEVDGTTYAAVVPGNDRINPEIALVSATDVGQSVRFTYRVRNRIGGAALPDRGLWMVDIPCRGVAPGGVGSAGGDWLAEFIPTDDGGVCQFSTLAEREMQPGDSSSLLTIESRFLPGFVMATAYGVAGPHLIPSDEETTPDTVRSLVVQLRAPGGSGSGRQVVAVVPFYDPSTLPGPITVIQLMRADLLAMCGDIGWITNRGICRSLEAKLQNAEMALLEDDNDAAQREMNAFTNELNAQRGKHIPETGFLMLSAMRQYLLRNM
jgi:hypothetical protein